MHELTGWAQASIKVGFDLRGSVIFLASVAAGSNLRPPKFQKPSSPPVFSFEFSKI